MSQSRVHMLPACLAAAAQGRYHTVVPWLSQPDLSPDCPSCRCMRATAATDSKYAYCATLLLPFETSPWLAERAGCEPPQRLDDDNSSERFRADAVAHTIAHLHDALCTIFNARALDLCKHSHPPRHINRAKRRCSEPNHSHSGCITCANHILTSLARARVYRTRPKEGVRRSRPA